MLDLGASLGFRNRFVAISDGKRVKKSLGVVPIARAIFHPGDCIRISRKEALNQSRGDANHRDRWDVVKINSEARVADALHDVAEVAVETFFADILVIKWRK